MTTNWSNLESVERKLYESLQASGELIPMTIEAVEEAEALFDEETVVLPISLRNPCDILRKAKLSVKKPSNDEPQVFGRLVTLLRKEMGLSVAALAERANVDEQELRRIEAEIDPEPKPRTVTQLAHVFRVLPKSLATVAHLTRQSDELIVEGAVKFAACSQNMDRLSKEELRALKEFVRLLNSLP